MQKKILAASIAALFASNALGANVVLQNEFIKAGVNETTGTLGSGGNTPPGLQYDGTGSGTFSNAFDYLTPGSPFEGFTVRITDSTDTVISTRTNNNAGNQASIAGGAWVGVPTTSSAIWGAATPEYNIRHTYSLPSMQTFIDISTRIEALSAMPKLYFGRFIDPDTRTASGDTSSTDNVLGYGAIPARNVVFSEAIVSRAALGLYSAAPNVGAGIGGGTNSWTTNPAVYYAGFSPYTSSGATVNFGRGDHTIGIGFLTESVNPGDIITFKYAYIFGPNAFGAASGAVSGGAGGGTPGTAPGGGTLVDVGSATDSASAPPPVTPPVTPPAPTVVSTTTVNNVVVTENVVTSLPVITGSVARHTASENSKVQTIARNTTTAVTTPWLRTTVTTPVITDNYSDSTTVTTLGTATVNEELFNVVDVSEANDSFSGRIDQHDKLANLNRGINRGLNMDAFRRDGICLSTDKTRVNCDNGFRLYVNGGAANANIDDGYKADSKTFGVATDYNVKSNWRVGAQVNRVTTKMSGVDSLTQQDKTHYGLFSVYSFNGFTLVNNLGYTQDGVNSHRNIEGMFENAHSVSGRSTWVNNRLYGPRLLGVSPFVGFTVGRTERNAYVESGSIQSARSVEASKNNNNYSEAGLRLAQSFGKLTLHGEVSMASDSFRVAEVNATYSPMKDVGVSVGFGRQVSDTMSSNSLSLRAVLKF